MGKYSEIIEKSKKIKLRNIPDFLNEEAFYSLVKRVAKDEYCDGILVKKIATDSGYDCYRMYWQKDKLVIEASGGSSLAAAFNRYLNDYCHYTVGALTVSGELPDVMPRFEGVIEQRSRFQYRYIYNYCTFGYTYAFYDWEDWEKTLDFINASLKRISRLEDISEALFFSKAYIRAVFKKEMGIGIMEYVRNKKVVRAHERISRGEKPTEIYTDCGFSTYSSFYRAYVAYFGFPPKTKKK